MTSKEKVKEWTLMFYFASDNPLASSIVSQLKAVKDAGYHPEANVICHFDPHDPDTPTHIFDVNHVSKFWYPNRYEVGFKKNDPFVRNMVMDRLWCDDAIRHAVVTKVEESFPQGGAFDPPKPTPEMAGEQDPDTALADFLDFCRESYPARHYMLFIMGHGQVVGNDNLLYDDHAGKKALTLTRLGEVLRSFAGDVEHDSEPGKVELITLHSCSMSAMEVIYELKGAANYLLASQGPTYVGNLPYKQILIRVFNDLTPQSASAGRNGNNGDCDEPKVVTTVVRPTEDTIETTLSKIFFYCLYNSYDFQLAGYPYDLCLTNLNKVPETEEPLNKLADCLIKALTDSPPNNPSQTEAKPNPVPKQLILLAHWDAQSFYQEDYVDLYDFCFCLSNRCEELIGLTALPSFPILTEMVDACKNMMDVLERGDGKLTHLAAFAGPAFQYSHGHSIYFPWARPADGMWGKQYEKYRLNEKTRWRVFLDEYFSQTMRSTREEELKKKGRLITDTGTKPASSNVTNEDLLALMNQIGPRVFAADGSLAKQGPDSPFGSRTPDDPFGGGTCSCPSIKNYPSSSREMKAVSENFMKGRAMVADDE